MIMITCLECKSSGVNIPGERECRNCGSKHTFKTLDDFEYQRIIDNIDILISNKREIDIDFMAEQIHKIWSKWYKHQRDNSTLDNIKRWDKQSETEYKNLSEEDKEKDRDIIKRYFNN